VKKQRSIPRIEGDAGGLTKQTMEKAQHRNTSVLHFHTYLLQKICYLMNLPDFYTESHKTTEFNHCIGVIVQYIQ